MKERGIGPDLSLRPMSEAVPVAMATRISLPSVGGADGGQGHSGGILEYSGIPKTISLDRVPSW